MSSARPQVTLLLVAYNQENFIREAVEGAFSQNYSPLRIVLSDDCSTDHTFQIMKDMADGYVGPHELVLNRNESNLGLIQHLNNVFSLVVGHYVAMCAGDDVSFSTRISDSVEIMIRHPELSALSMGIVKASRFDRVLESRAGGKLVEPVIFSIEDFNQSTTVHINAPARMLRKDVIEAFGPLNHGCQVEDQTMMFRALLRGKIGKTPVPRVMYRVHDTNMSAGEGVRAFDFNKIYESCFVDLEYARNEGWLGEVEYQQTRKGISRRKRRDEHWRGYKNARFKWVYLAFKILPSPVIPLRGKWRRIKALFKKTATGTKRFEK